MKAIRIVAGVAAALAVGAGVYLWTPPPAPFDRQAALAAAGGYDVRIVRDRFGVPHIYGERDADAAFGLAYAHAEDDWKTIEDVLLFSRGEAGLRTGREGAVTDYLIAALGAWDDIRAKYATDLSPETRALVEAYADGVNFWCAEKPGRCAAGIAPVRGEDIVAGFVIRTPFFYGLDESLRKLFDGDPDKVAMAEAARTAILRAPPGVEIGSNAIAVAPSRASDGRTRLMVNSHQPYTGPVAWYEARIKTEEGWDLVGGLFPGSPVISHGAGPNLGWAFTVNHPDLVDVYVLDVDDEKNPTRYMMDGEWRALERAEAKFRVRLFGPFSLPASRPLYRSAHGPVFVTKRGVFAVSYGGMGDVRGAEQFYRLNKAQTFEDWRAAMAMQAVPSFNVVYADAGGRIAYFYNAAIPERSGNVDWSGTLPGDQSALVWGGVRPFGSAPFVVNPASGFVVNGNNNPFESTAPEESPRREDFPPHFGVDDRTTNRGLRLLELYGGDDEITGDEFVAYKMDELYAENSRLVRLIDALLADPSAANDPALAEALGVLRAWDRSARKESRSAALAIRTGRLALGWYLAGSDAETPDPKAALAQAARELEETFGRIDPEWGEAMRLVRGEARYSLDGGPETLRAVYPDGAMARGAWVAAGGDTYILYADWPSDGGAPTIKTIHQFGAATLDPTSPHFADQAPLFVAEQWKEPPMSLEKLLTEATADYRPGGR